MATRDWLFGLILLGMVLLAYSPAWNGQPLWDDEAHITRPDLRSVEGLGRIWTELGATQQYYPLLHSAFWIEHKLWDDTTLYYHLLNLILHAGSGLLLLKIVRRLGLPGGHLAALLFALHPVMVESVAWISEQKNTLSTVFYLGAGLACLKFDQTRNPRLYVGALVLFGLGLLSKTVIATLPAALLVVLWWKRGALSWKRDVTPLIPFFIAGIGAGLFTAWVEQKFIHARGADFGFSLVERCLIAGRVFWFYLGKLFWPADLSFIYPRWNVSQSAAWQYLFPAAALMLLAAAWRVRGRWRGPLAALLFFGGTLFPALGFFNVYPFRFSFVADHFQYLASIGIITFLACGVADWWMRRPHASRVLMPGIVLACLMTLGVLTWRQCRIYTDSETLWRATLARNSGSWMVHNNLGTVLLGQNRLEDAAVHFRKAAEFYPDHPGAHYNLGMLFFRRDQMPEAIVEFRRALESEPMHMEAHVNLGAALLQLQQTDEAIVHFEEALRISPDKAEAHSGLGEALLLKGRPADAIVHFKQAAELRPDNAMFRYNLGSGFLVNGDTDEGIAALEQALALRPDLAHAHSNLGYALSQKGRLSEAIAHLRQAVQLQPDYPDARLNLANTLLQIGRTGDAVVQYEALLRLQPRHVAVLNHLAGILATHPDASIRNIPKAIAFAERANELSNGEDPAVLRTLASAYAGAGRRTEALAVAQQALSRAKAQSNTALIAAIEDQLRSYENAGE